jgi:SpoVK/Ycf46/Vps4 family AAA+-type ATPase
LACSAATGGGGNGLCLLFHGPSGVGKTMMANACASHVKKKVKAEQFWVGVRWHEQDTAGFATSPGVNASAESLWLQVLLINFPSLGNNEAGETIRFIFREAKIHDAVRSAQ